MTDQAHSADPEDGPRIISTEGVCGDRPRIRGTRVRVVDVLDMLAAGMSQASAIRLTSCGYEPETCERARSWICLPHGLTHWLSTWTQGAP